MAPEATQIDTALILGRLEALERENRRLKRGWSVVVVAGLGLALMGQVRPARRPVIDTDRLVIRDAGGQVRIQMAVTDLGAPYVQLTGLGKISLAANPDGSSRIAILDATGKDRDVMVLGADGRAAFEVHGPAGGLRGALQVGPDGEPSVRLWGKSGLEQASFFALDDSGGLLLNDAGGKTRGAFAVGSDGSASIDFMDKADKARLSLGAKADGSPRADFVGDNDKLLLRLPDQKSLSH